MGAFKFVTERERERPREREKEKEKEKESKFVGAFNFVREHIL